MNGRLNAADFSDPAIALNGPTQGENQNRETNGHAAEAAPNPMKMESIRSRDCRSRISPKESGPIIQAPHVTSSAVES
jgi:hypothetical protein